MIEQQENIRFSADIVLKHPPLVLFDANEVSRQRLYHALTVADERQQALLLSTEQVKALRSWIDDLIRADVEAYLEAMEDDEADHQEEQAFIAAANLAFWADDDPADSVYDDL